MKKRMFLGILMLAMLIGLLPVIRASAVITEINAVHFEFSEASDMKDFVPGQRYLYRYSNPTASNLLIDTDTVISGYTRVSVDEEFIIPEGITLTIMEEASLYVDKLTVHGSLICHGSLQVGAGLTTTLTISESGSIGGTGKIFTIAHTPDQAREFLVAENGRKYYLEWNPFNSWIVKDVTGLSQLDTPTNLEWGYTAEPQYNEELGTMEVIKTPLPGSLIFNTADLSQNQYWMHIYREGGNGVHGRRGESLPGASLASVDFRDVITESGTYHAVLRSEGDFTEYYSSGPIFSEPWTYVKPSAQIEKCTNLTWGSNNITWEMPENSDGFELWFYYAPDLDTEPTQSASVTLRESRTFNYSSWKNYLHRYGAGYYYFKVKAFSKDITKWCNSEWSDLSEPYYYDGTIPNPFADVSADAYYFNPVQWAVTCGITQGMTDTTFAPENTCTRAQIVTFLWRACGSPKVSGTNPFTDVPADAWYADAVLWAVETGITSGTSATTFSPDAGCTRGQVATFLWRSQGQPASGGSNIFTDIASGAYYYDAVLWAVANGITNGMGEGLFAPDATCTRGQIVTFLYRAMA